MNGHRSILHLYKLDSADNGRNEIQRGEGWCSVLSRQQICHVSQGP